MSIFRRDLSTDRIDSIVGEALEHAEAQDHDKAWAAAQPLLKAQKSQTLAALALADLVERRAFPGERALECTQALFAAHKDDVPVVAAIAEGLEAVHDIRFLNSAPPTDPVFEGIAKKLSEAAKTARGEDQPKILCSLATVARLLGRSWDAVAEDAYRRLTQASPELSRHWYNLGLFYKTRGRFEEGLAANQRAFDSGGAEQESVQWNLGICATGARHGEAALKIWKLIGQKIQMGRFDLPEGKYGPVKVRLAERPLAERDPSTQPDDPGDEETVWVERLSPCHGIVESALYHDSIGVDYGDVVMFDGAAITHHTYGDDRVPVFPHLATLVRSGFQIFRFAGTQENEKQIAKLSHQLPDDAILYVHTEQFEAMCSSCWNDPERDHADHSSSEHHLVTGKLCAPPSLPSDRLLDAVDRAVAADGAVRLFIPDLAEAAGQRERAAVERRRTAMLES